jgi:hypothetical protein
MINISDSIEACANHYGDQADAMRAYLLEGQERSLALPNRGPLVFTDTGELAENIRTAYSEFGFYILEGVLGDWYGLNHWVTR